MMYLKSKLLLFIDSKVTKVCQSFIDSNFFQLVQTFPNPNQLRHSNDDRRNLFFLSCVSKNPKTFLFMKNEHKNRILGSKAKVHQLQLQILSVLRISSW